MPIKNKTSNQGIMVDFHCHILPGVDDGAKDMEETVKMLKIASAEGITHIIATPHFKINHHNKSPEKIEEVFENVKKAAIDNNIDIKIYCGSEVMFFNDIESVYEEKRIRTLNSSDYLLVEFYPDDEFKKIRDGLETIRSLGLIPVLAHIERYKALRGNYSNTKLLYDSGVVISVNAGSVMGKDGLVSKIFVRKLLKDRFVSLISTDSHDSEKRNPKMDSCRDYLISHYDQEYVNKVLYKNALTFFNLDE